MCHRAVRQYADRQFSFAVQQYYVEVVVVEQTAAIEATGEVTVIHLRFVEFRWGVEGVLEC